MQNIVTIDDFIGVFNVGQKSSKYVQEILDNLIAIYQPEYLLKAIGKDLYEDYKINNQEPIYDGFNEVLSGDNSPLVAYIYFYYLREGSEFATGTGIKRLKGANSEDTPHAYKSVRTWERVVKRTRDLRVLIYDNEILRDITNPRQMCSTLSNRINPFDL